MTLFESIAGFILCSAAIVFAGTKLSFYGNQIAELTGLGKAWLGLVIMAAVTSLPELITGISSVAIIDAPNLAASDVFGSCVFNLLILSMLDAIVKKPLTSLVRNTHVFAAACGIILITLAAFGIILSNVLPVIGWFSIITLVIFAVYIFSVWLIFRFEKKSLQDIGESRPLSEKKAGLLRKTLLLYGLNALIVIGAAIFLPFFGENISLMTGLGNTFFGTLFLAASTSLPELVVSVSAVRLGSLDIAVGNLFGSNIFNIFILGLDDVIYNDGSLFARIDQSHLLSILTVIIMTSVAMTGLLFRQQRKRFVLATDTFIILLLYGSLMFLLYKMRI